MSRSALKVGLIMATLLLTVSGDLTKQEGSQRCVDSSGLKPSEILEFRTRNEECTIDCKTKQGQLLSTFRSDGVDCGSSLERKCYLGKCLSKKEIGDVDISELYNVSINIISARVADLDILPGGGASDTYVTVFVQRGAEPIYPDNDIVCYTYVVLDNERPRWRFICRPRPLRASTVLRFHAFDSDKPLTEAPENLGYHLTALSEIINKGPTRLPLTFRGKVTNYYIEVDVKGKPYKSIY